MGALQGGGRGRKEDHERSRGGDHAWVHAHLRQAASKHAACRPMIDYVQCNESTVKHGSVLPAA
jgi:hypothetical protein